MKRSFCLGFVILFLSGCAGLVKFDPVANQNLRTIGLVEVANPQQFEVRDSLSTERAKIKPGLGGLIAIVGAAVSTAKKEATGVLQQEISDSGFSFGRQMTEELAKALRNANYEAIIISSTERDKTNAGAYLTVEYEGVGYRYSGKSNDVFPYIQQRAYLSKSLPKSGEKPDKDILYSSIIAYGGVHSIDVASVVVIPIQERYVFDITKPENKPLIVEGLQAGITAIAEQVAADLRK